MLDSGHSREAVLNYELPYLYAFMEKKLDIIERSKSIKPRETTTRKGRKRTVKRMTSKQMAAKLRAKRK